MPLIKTARLIFTALLIGLATGPSPITHASDQDATGEEDIAPAQPAAHGPLRSAAAEAVPAAIENHAKLIGTAVFEGGSSIAVLQLTSGIRFVREGDEILPGMRLVKVTRNRIEVERAGVLGDIRSRWESGSVGGGRAIQADTGGLQQPRSRMARSQFYSQQAQR
jgi:hypothetical protein